MASVNSSSQEIQPASRQFKLVSVSFKEAALDSPSFRATVNHLDIQIDNVEKWLVALSSSVRKIPKYVKELQMFSNSFLEHLLPTFLQEGLIDQEYTVGTLKDSLVQLRKLWRISLEALNVNPHVIESLSHSVSRSIHKYKEIRKKFEATQEKYDTYLAIFVATPKAKGAESVIEDARHLFDVRKEYIHCSLELMRSLSDLGNCLDKHLVKMIFNVWTTKMHIFNGDFDFVSEQAKKVQRVQTWCDYYNGTIEKMYNDMQMARTQIEESSINQVIPPTNPDLYNISLIDYHSLRDIDEPSTEKHGYLFMKTWIDKSSKPIWVKRWSFIKGGLFGMLLLSPSQTFVQETDKFGILLCHVKYSPSDDRRYCFEVKTADVSITLQAETLFELKSWLKVFENEKNRVMQETTESILRSVSSGRYPPIVMEFASTANTTVDREIVSQRILNASGQIVTSSRLSTHIERNEKYFQKHIYYQIPTIRPPIMTDTTKSSIIAYSFAATNTLPTALTANIWGSVNWGLYYLHTLLESEEDMNDDAIDQDLVDKDLSGSRLYPDYYPYELAPLDIQLRALFETAVDPGEYCLLSFRCIWAPNSRQELSGRCFITSKHIYFYMQISGFVSLYKGLVRHQVAVDCIHQKDFDLLKIFFIEGLLKVKVFMDDGFLIKQKMIYLINNKASEKPKGLEDLIGGFKHIEEAHYESLLEKSDANRKSIDSILRADADFKSSFTNAKSGPFLDKYKVDFREEGRKVFEKVYNLPPKALFHSFLGDNSIILKVKSPLTALDSLVKKSWSVKPNGHMQRKINLKVTYASGKKGTMQLEQVIDNIVENDYYTFTYKKSSFQLFVGSSFTVKYRVVIVGISGKRSKIYIYSKRDFSKSSIFNMLIDEITYYLDVNQMKNLDKQLQGVVDQIGTHGMIVKAIYFYGKLSYTDKFEDVDLPKPLKFGLVNILVILLKKFILTFLFILSYVIQIFANGLITFVRGVRMNQILILVLMGSVFFNFYLVGRSTLSFWTVRSADKIAHKYFTAEPLMLQRALYAKETQDLIEENFGQKQTNVSHSRCSQRYREISFILNFDRTVRWTVDYADDNTREVARSLRMAFQEVGIKRNELIVKLNMLNSMEREIANGEWKNWLSSEILRCEYIKENVVEFINNSESTSGDIQSGIDSILEYCMGCSEDYKRAAELL
ncbi:uncharacterized protein PRCAT00006159001 [Priceomyces carsonii]|uniref:uncharacterized protein n=1 Tax=Priceomyces carsonii TaxID=28549 RepID=UPI002EDB13E4|nr:unnamed protein product [Priceomyces carsonii]